MKQLKILGVFATATCALMLLAGGATATPVLTSPAGTEYTGEIHWTLATPDSSIFKAGIENTCGESTIKGTITVNNTQHAAGANSVLSFGDCSQTNTVLSNGSLTIAAGGAVTLTGNEVTTKALGVSCVYGGGTGTVLGKLEGGSPAVLNAATTQLPKISGGFLCASKGTWTAKYTVTTPSTLLVD